MASILEIGWLSFCTLLASGLCPLVIGQRAARHFLTSIILSLLFHASVAILLTIRLSLGSAIITMSTAVLTWGLLAYFLLLRFRPLNRTLLVMQLPSLFPLVNLAGLASSILAFVLYAHWYLFPVPLTIWFGLGLFSAEVAIRSEIRDSRREGREIDRRSAIFNINYYQGRSGAFSLIRYPFP